MLKLLRPASPEDLFIQRYDVLMAWALALTNGNRALAEDLVHDAFIQFTLRRSELGAIENTDAYLNRTLRNMYLSQVRRAAVIQDKPFSIANFDSAEIGLRSIDSRERVDVQDDLRRICQYVCARKDSSKAGCVLILRFFHGYYPSEIARVLRTSRKAVDRYLLIARRESKLYLSDPAALKPITNSPVAGNSSLGYVRPSNELLAELRQTIFASGRDECREAERLKELYEPTAGALDVKVVSHVVSCPRCLDAVNQLLGLPLLADRTADDRLGRDVPPDGRGGGGEGGSGTTIVESKKRYERRLRETVEHRPQELRIAVNGFVLGSQQVSSEFNRQELSVNVDEPIGFVEVFSEQGLRLLFFDVDQPIDGIVEQSARAEFDCGRALDLSLSFRGPWPALHVSYHDPTFEAVESNLEDEVQRSAGVQSPKTKVPSPLRRLGAWTRDLGRSTLDFGLWWRPGTITALFALVLVIAAVLIYKRTPPGPISAADLLQRAVASEDILAANRDQVLHRTITLEEQSESGQVLSTRRIDSWQSAEKGITARRLFDENGSLIAGDWTRSDGVRTLYHHGKRPQLQTRNPQSAIRNFEDAWQLSPSAREFTALLATLDAAQVEERGSSYLLTYQNEVANQAQQGLIRATLTLGKTDLHATEQTLVVRQGSEERTFHYLETSFERRPLSAVAPAVFEAEPELLSSTRLETPNSKLETDPASPLALGPSPVIATPVLEVEVLRLLNSAGGDLSDQVNVTRTSDGRLHIGGTVETADRKTAILRALNAVANHPAVRISLESIAEAEQRQRQSGAGTPKTIELQQVQIANVALPIEPDLRRYFAGRGLSSEQLDQEITRFASRVMRHSLQARLYARTLKQTVNRFSSDDLRGLTPDARQKLLALIGEQAANLHRELSALGNDLQAVVPGSAPPVEQMEISSDADLLRAVNRLGELVSQSDESIRASFSLSSEGLGAAPVKDAQFWRSLKSAESLAARISKQ